jgi:hypothetical protein
MKEIKIDGTQKYFNEHYPFADPPDLAERKECLHCEGIIIVGNYKVFQGTSGFEYICCPNAPKCDSTVIDWIPVES